MPKRRGHVDLLARGQLGWAGIGTPLAAKMASAKVQRWGPLRHSDLPGPAQNP